ncbi:hypothetical protein [Pseudovibrio axinellae]|nr:hypothetical protein [Pseudovibrio axinellae]
MPFGRSATYGGAGKATELVKALVQPGGRYLGALLIKQGHAVPYDGGKKTASMGRRPDVNPKTSLSYAIGTTMVSALFAAWMRLLTAPMSQRWAGIQSQADFGASVLV